MKTSTFIALISLFFGSFVGIAYSQGYIAPTSTTYRIISIERDPEKIQCGSQWSDTIMTINLQKVSDNSSGWVWVSTNKPAYKDVLAIALTALTSGMNVAVAADVNDARSCGGMGKLLSIFISNSL
jgi:hypothetical protein